MELGEAILYITLAFTVILTGNLLLYVILGRKRKIKE